MLNYKRSQQDNSLDMASYKIIIVSTIAIAVALRNTTIAGKYFVLKSN